MSDSIESQIGAEETTLEAQIDDQIRRADNLDEESIVYLIDKIRKRRALLSVKPEFTPEVVGIAKQIIAFGGAGFGFVLAFNQSIPQDLGAFKIAVAILYINFILVSMAILAWFFIQARTRYPWLYLERLGNSNQYFYYNAIPIDYRFRPYYAFRRNAQLGSALRQYLQNLSEFSARSINETKRDELKNELIQYHLLLFYQGYLDQYEQQLTHTSLYGFGASLIGAIVVFSAKAIGLFP